MKNQELYLIKEVINVVKNKGNNKFKLALIINEQKIDERIEILKKLNEPSELFQEFETKRRELMAAHAEQDGNGQIIVYSEPDGKGEIIADGNGYPNITQEKEVFAEKSKELLDEYKEVIEAEQKKESDFMETLEQDIEPAIELNKIQFDSLPELSFEEMKTLMPLIEK